MCWAAAGGCCVAIETLWFSEMTLGLSVRASKAPQYPQKRFESVLMAAHFGQASPGPRRASVLTPESSTVPFITFWIACNAAVTASSLGLGRRKSCFILTKKSSAAEFATRSSASLFSGSGPLVLTNAILVRNTMNTTESVKLPSAECKCLRKITQLLQFRGTVLIDFLCGLCEPWRS